MGSGWEWGEAGWVGKHIRFYCQTWASVFSQNCTTWHQLYSQDKSQTCVGAHLFICSPKREFLVDLSFDILLIIHLMHNRIPVGDVWGGVERGGGPEINMLKKGPQDVVVI